MPRTKKRRKEHGCKRTTKVIAGNKHTSRTSHEPLEMEAVNTQESQYTRVENNVRHDKTYCFDILQAGSSSEIQVMSPVTITKVTENKESPKVNILGEESIEPSRDHVHNEFENSPLKVSCDNEPNMGENILSSVSRQRTQDAPIPFLDTISTEVLERVNKLPAVENLEPEVHTSASFAVKVVTQAQVHGDAETSTLSSVNKDKLVEDTASAEALPISIVIESQINPDGEDNPLILPLDPELLSILGNNCAGSEKPIQNIEDLNLTISQSNLHCTLQFEDSRCSHLFSGLSADVSKIDAEIENEKIVESSRNGEINSDVNISNTQNNSTRSIISMVIDNNCFPAQQSSNDEIHTEGRNKGRPRKGRKRKHAEQNRIEKKAKLNTGQEYVNYKGEKVKKKIFAANFDCKCPKKCTEKVTEAQREIIFKNYWSAGSYEARCAILQGSCKEIPIKRSYRNTNKRSFTREYFLNKQPVCKKLFLSTFSISQKPLDVALTKLRKDQPLNDGRGVATGGRNKTSEEKLKEIVEFIKLLPKYKSHYCRDNTSSKYLAPNLNISIIYDLYKQKHASGVSKSCFKNIFYTHFNLRFKKPQKDTCVRCDVYEARKRNISGKELEDLEAEHNSHLDRAKALRQRIKSDVKLAIDDNTTETLTFDLEKTHFLPRIPTNIVYYKRQLNLYNLGIYQASTNKGYFNVWLEYEGGRGTQEVGSCLTNHILKNLNPDTTNLILWADSCGGQNKSIKLVVMMMHLLLNHETLQKITMRFLQPGHTYLPNDSEFGDLESALKTSSRLYTDEDYIHVMNVCRRKNKFIVNRIIKEDFRSVEPLLKAITNRKQDTHKNKISWLNTSEIEMRKYEPLKLFFKSDINSEHVQVVNISKPVKARQIPFKEIKLPILWPNGKQISTAKIKDLKDMVKLVPNDSKVFYNFLKNEGGDFEDDVEGFGDTVDIEILEWDTQNI